MRFLSIEESIENYVQQHRVEEFIQELLEAIVANRPDHVRSTRNLHLLYDGVCECVFGCVVSLAVWPTAARRPTGTRTRRLLHAQARLAHGGGHPLLSL
jgi:hypothetical protein